jgi:ABC-2 type transport system permease protein
MFKPLIRILSFFGKEINEIRRQPKLVLSLLLGPFLIVLLFGMGFQGDRPNPRTILVIPQLDIMEQVWMDALKQAISTKFTLIEETSDLDGALARLRAGEVDVVEALPADAEKDLTAGKQLSVDFSYSEVDPLEEQWIQYMAYAQVVEINRELQRQAIQIVQTDLENRGVKYSLPSEMLVSPVKATYQNHQAQTLDFMTFYAPSVLALILQHIAVTLGALSLVRERLLGAFELFRVAPVTLLQMLLGKYLAYTMFIGIITATLVVLLGQTPLAIPFLGSYLLFAGLVVVFTLASLGIGFAISAWSSTDSQAVQLSMLVLLMSIFFSGFFLPLEQFTPGFRMISYALPLTHGIRGFQSIMLRGTSPSAFTWLALALIAGVTFLVVRAIAQYRFHRI